MSAFSKSANNYVSQCVAVDDVRDFYLSVTAHKSRDTVVPHSDDRYSCQQMGHLSHQRILAPERQKIDRFIFYLQKLRNLSLTRLEQQHMRYVCVRVFV